MSRVEFKTGKDHQERAAVWARQRLADGNGRRFRTPNDQDGVLLADGVGLGKTWEALAAAALILYKSAPERSLRHVLILCPANLVTKWEDELAPGSPFQKRLQQWRNRLERNGHGAAARRVSETLSNVLPIRKGQHVRVQKSRGKFHPPGGIYVVSQSLITGPGAGLSALRREPWDVIIVDEAHNASARKALAAVQSRQRAPVKLLLSATPFQLEPRQWNKLAKNLVSGNTNVLNQAEVARYIDEVAAAFGAADSPGPSRSVVADASRTLRLIAARTVPAKNRRRYEMLTSASGTSVSMPSRLDDLSARDIADLLRALSNPTVKPDKDFEQAYFEERVRLATQDKRTYVATRLRRLLAKGHGDVQSPRMTALEAWARRTLESDLEASIQDGTPRKMLVFTAWVGEPLEGEAELLKRLLTRAFAAALAATKKKHRKHWKAWVQRGRDRLTSLASEDDQLEAALLPLAEDELTCVLAGRSQRPTFVNQLKARLAHRVSAIHETEETLSESNDRNSFESRALRRRIRDMRAALAPSQGRAHAAVERYTGHEMRSDRDRTSTAFKEAGLPWVLVASNVGSEGIDLHTFTNWIVHYDLEWNPARMEQREGRGDRVGRLLKSDLGILYCIVPRTYDERMFHQLVARDRWHGVLLGKPAMKLADISEDAPLVVTSRVKSMRLDLAP